MYIPGSIVIRRKKSFGLPPRLLQDSYACNPSTVAFLWHGPRCENHIDVCSSGYQAFQPQELVWMQVACQLLSCKMLDHPITGLILAPYNIFIKSFTVIGLLTALLKPS